MSEEKKNHTFEDVRDLYSRYIHNPDDLALIKRAYDFAEKAHEGQLRKSGDPYILHLIEVAYIIASLQAGPVTIAAAFLHDTIEDCNVTKEDLEKNFNKDIAEIVFCLTKIKALSHNKRHDKDFAAEDHRKIFLGMAKDIRVILIKLADRMHNMRTLEFQTPEKKVKISQETMDVYVPIADRLGLSTIKGELEDLCLRWLHPVEYQQIMDYLNANMANREQQIKKLAKKVADLLIPTKIPFEISSRVKHPSSIYHKMVEKDKKLDEIYDIIAMRIITQTSLECYEILGLIHSEYTPLANRFKDYIAVPKPNMYQSLHTTIIDRDSTVLEIQIRTKEMDEIAEGGVAAHWRYKENEKYDPKKEQKEIMEKLHWFSEFVSLSSQNEGDEDDAHAKEYMETLQHEIFGSNIYVFTPHGKVIELPVDSTPVDFAYKVHSKVGDTAVGALVNNTLVPLSTPLKTGDVVEIRTQDNSTPNEGWLKFVKTSQAKKHIQKFVMQKNSEFLRETNIDKGKSSLVELFREYGMNEAQMVEKLNEDVFKHFECTSADDLFVKIATTTLQPSDITTYLGIRKEDYVESIVKKQVKEKKIKLSSQAVLVKGQTNILCTLASCCTPIPGDDIIGYITQGKGIKVHRKSCPNIKNEVTRLIDVDWNPNYSTNNVPVELELRASDRDNLLIDVLNTLAQLKVTCQKIVSKLHKENLTTSIDITINVSNVNELNNICNALINVTSVFSVERLMH